MRRITGAIVCMIAAAVAVILGTSTAQAAPLYGIEVTTCDVNNAGTDANVRIQLVGTLGFTGFRIIDNPGDDRERGDLDTYNKEFADVGPITAVNVDFDDSGDSPDWCMEKIVIFGPHSVTVHPFGDFLTEAGVFTFFAV